MRPALPLAPGTLLIPLATPLAMGLLSPAPHQGPSLACDTCPALAGDQRGAGAGGRAAVQRHVHGLHAAHQLRANPRHTKYYDDDDIVY